MVGSSINVGSQTRLADIQNFALGLRDDQTLHAKTGKNGEVVLYTKTEKTGLAKLLHNLQTLTEPSAAKKQALARDTVASLLSKASPGSDKAALSALSAALDPASCKSLQGASLKIYAAAVQEPAVQAGIPDLKVGQGTTDALVSGLWDEASALEGFEKTPDEVRANLKEHRPEFDAAREAAGHAIVEDIRSQGADASAIQHFVLAGSSTMNEGLSQAMREDGPVTAHSDALREIMQEGVDRSVIAARRELADFKFNGETTVSYKGRPVPVSAELVSPSDGKTYRDPKVLGVGGFGMVVSYTDENGKSVAAKVALNRGPEAMAEMEAEVAAHGTVTGHDNVVGFLGVAVDEQGRPAMIMEYAENGDLPDLLAKMLPADPKTEAADARDKRLDMVLLLGQDITKGVKHVTDDCGVIHSDLKTTNIFVGGEHKLKIADFGLSRLLANYSLSSVAAKNMGAEYNAPEFTRAQKDLVKKEDAFQELGDTGMVPDPVKIGALSSQVGVAFGAHLADDQRDALRAAVDERLIGTIQSAIVPDMDRLALANESWALGATIFEMALGRTPYSRADGDAYNNYGPDSRAIDTSVMDKDGGRDPSSLAGSTGNAQLDDLLNQLLHPDPAQRPSKTEALAHPAFASIDGRADSIRVNIAAL